MSQSKSDATVENEHLNSQDNPPSDHSFADHVFAKTLLLEAWAYSIIYCALQISFLMERLRECSGSEGRTTLMESLLRSNAPLLSYEENNSAVQSTSATNNSGLQNTSHNTTLH